MVAEYALLVASSIFAPERWEQLLCWGNTGSPVALSHRDWQFCFAGLINAQGAEVSADDSS